MKTNFLALTLSLAMTGAVFPVEYAKWSWSVDLPTQLSTVKQPAHRTAAEFDKYFKAQYHGGSVKGLLAYFGRPDAFSRQNPYSKTHGSAKPSRNGGTLLFRLEDGGVAHVRTIDFESVADSLRYDAAGRGTLLYK